MGRKGVSKRKPKQSNSFSNDKNKSSSNAHPNQGTSVQSLVKDNGATLNKGGTNSLGESDKKNRKGR